MRSSNRKRDDSMKKQTMGMMIASLRREAGLTQAGLAAEMGVTDKAVSKWERDLSFPDIASIPRLAELLGVTVEELMQVKEQERTSEAGGVRQIVTLVLRAVGLAMGVALAALAVITKELDVNSCFTMAGLGIACLGISLLSETKEA